MGWVSIGKPDGLTVYYGIETQLGEGVEICDSCQQPTAASRGYSPNDNLWLCYRCQTLKQDVE